MAAPLRAAASFFNTVQTSKIYLFGKQGFTEEDKSA